MAGSNPAPAAPPGPRRIVVGFDGSDPSQRAVRLALAWAHASGASVWIVHARETPRTVAEPITEEEQGKGSAAVTEALDDLSRYAASIDVRVTVEVREGVPAEVLLRAVPEIAADLIVVGTRGLRGPARVLLGSVSSRVVGHATVPVVVVP